MRQKTEKLKYCLRYEFIPNYNRNILLTIIDVWTAAAVVPSSE